MRRTPLVAALALIAGCSVTPKEAREITEPWQFTSTHVPQRAAHCMRHNLENMSSIWRAQIRPWTEPNSLEFVTPAAEVLAEIYPTPQGSRVTLWLSHAWIGVREEQARKIMKGC